jgi:hypothetical protein
VVEVVEQEKAVDQRYREVSSELVPIEELLKRKRENVTFAEFVAAEGMKEIMSSLSDDINALVVREEGIGKDLDELEDILKLDSKWKRQINDYYQARMKEFLASLSVNVLSADDYKTFDRQIRTNALGSDLPRSLLAQHFAFLHTMEKFNPSIACPLVLDSPLQQEQDKSNIGAIFSFIFSRVLPGQQLILGTLSLDDVPNDVVPADAKRIHLSEELHLLEKKQYPDVLKRIGKMHEQTLAAE